MPNNDEILARKLFAEGEYYNKLITRNLDKDIDMNLISRITNEILCNKDYVYSISKARNVNPDFITLSEMFRIKLLSVIGSCYKFDLAENPDLIINDNYIKCLSDETYRGLLIANYIDLLGSTSFNSNPAIALPLFILNLLKESGMDIKGDLIKKDVYRREISELISSIEAMFTLFNNKCFPQAMSVFRQALEIFITIRTLDLFPESLESFIKHQAVTIDDALETMGKKKLDEYITSNNLTYNNYKSYLNYGWLDSIEKFRKMKEGNPRIKYSIKTTAEISDSMEFYDAMNFASNYVHSNFVFVDINWDVVLSEVLDGVYQIIDWLIEHSITYNKDVLVLNGLDYSKLYKTQKDRILKVIKKGTIKKAGDEGIKPIKK